MQSNSGQKNIISAHKSGDFFVVQLTQGKETLIDKEDIDLIQQYKWHYRKSGRTNGRNGYAESKKGVFMHNLIINKVGNLVIDHINRNGLDNRRSNLRLVTKQQNHHNFPKKGHNKYRGVQLKPNLKLNPWEVILKYNKKVVFNKTFATAEEGAKAYNEQAIKYYGDVAQLNIIK